MASQSTFVRFVPRRRPNGARSKCLEIGGPHPPLRALASCQQPALAYVAIDGHVVHPKAFGSLSQRHRC